MSLKKHLTKLCEKRPLHLQFVLALPLEIWGDRLSRQCSTYMYILMNHWIATNTTGSHCHKNRQTCSKLHNLFTTWSKCPPPARTKVSDVDELRRCVKNEWTVWITLFIEHVIGDVAPASTCLHSWWHFEHYDVMMMWLRPTTCLSSFKTINASRFVALQWIVKMYM